MQDRFFLNLTQIKLLDFKFSAGLILKIESAKQLRTHPEGVLESLGDPAVRGR